MKLLKKNKSEFRFAVQILMLTAISLVIAFFVK